MLPLVPCHELDEVLAAPLGRVFVGHGFAAWFASPSFNGSIHFGPRDPRDVPAMVALHALARHPALSPPFHRLVDGRELTSIEPTDFEAAHARLAPMIPALRPLVGRQAVLVRPGFRGMAKAALLAPLGGRAPFQVFDQPDEAYRYVFRDQAAEVQALVEDATRTVVDAPAALRALRDWLERNLGDAAIEDAACALHVSKRTLQRALAGLGTSYRRELSAARARVAAQLLAESDLKVDVVALRVGCAGASQLGAVLRRAGLPHATALRRA